MRSSSRGKRNQSSRLLSGKSSALNKFGSAPSHLDHLAGKRLLRGCQDNKADLLTVPAHSSQQTTIHSRRHMLYYTRPTVATAPVSSVSPTPLPTPQSRPNPTPRSVRLTIHHNHHDSISRAFLPTPPQRPRPRQGRECNRGREHSIGRGLVGCCVVCWQKRVGEIEM